MVKGNKLISLVVAALVLGLVTAACAEQVGSPSTQGPPTAVEGLQAVPAAPNDSIITGNVTAIEQTADGWQIDMQLLSSQDVPGWFNMTKPRVGQTVSAFTREEVGEITVGDVITAHMEVRGDERGIRFFVREICIP